MIVIRVNCDDKEKMIDQAEQELDYMAEKDSLRNPPFVNREKGKFQQGFSLVSQLSMKLYYHPDFLIGQHHNE